jgi:hypothetical protein
MPAPDDVGLPHVLEQVDALFAQALGRPMSEIGITEDRANQLVKSRLQILTNFQSKHLPPDISDAFDDAIKFTSGFHAFASGFVKITKLLAPLGDFAEKDLYGIAFLEQHNSQEPGEHLDIKLDTYSAIMEEVSNPTSRSFSQVLKEKFEDRSATDRIIAELTATLLVARQSSLSSARHGMLAACNIGMICRSVFYQAIIEKQGSRLGQTAAQRAFAEKLQDVPWEIASHIPIVGDLIGPFRIALGLIAALANKDLAVEEIKGRLEDSYDIVSEFIQTYIYALHVWSEWAIGVHDILITMIKNDLPAFQTSPVGGPQATP